MTIDPSAMNAILEAAAAEGRDSLLEHEVYALLTAAGCRVPRFRFLPPNEEPDAAALRELAGEGGELVVKVVSPAIAHKTDVGGVARAAADPVSVRAVLARMREEVPRRFRGEAALRGFLLCERVALEGTGPGSELLVGLRHNREFGPVLTLGVGGIDTELLGEACRSGQAVVSASALAARERLLAILEPTLAYRRLAGRTREGRRLVSDAAILETLDAFRAIAEQLARDDGEGRFTVTELEVNPFGVSRGALVALDGLLRFRPRRPLPLPRPLASLDRLLRPESAAVIGVSSKGMNMGRIILRNILESGFDRARTYVVRPGETELDGVRCVPSVAELPERVDLLVVVVGADQVPELLEELARHDRATGVILIPGGMGEKEGGAALEARTHAALEAARRAGRSLVACGGNCLGIVSRPGRYHTLFIPPSKLPLREDGKGNLAFISQSGAYMISRMSKLAWLSPRYAVSTGNQVDLTVSDFLRKLAEDPEVRTFACYVEGFKDGDGQDFAAAVSEVVASGRDVIFYKAGRTAEGKSASSGHTASLAGDYDVCAALLREAGAHVAHGFVEFLDLCKLSSLQGAKRWAGPRLGALSNAGFEAVGIADALRGEGHALELARLAEPTRARLADALRRARLDALVDVRNPLDLTPMASDEAHEDAVRALLDDPGVDLVLCATIPLTPAMATLAGDVPPEQSIASPGSLIGRLGRLAPTAEKPIVCSLDSGALYDPMACALEEAGLPCFRSADDAVRTMGRYLAGRTRARV
jgi:acyl-CoA synthetase (NDP forming)